MRFSDVELQTIRALFSDENNLKLLRKVFLPEYDYEAPVGQVIDLWLACDVEKLSAEEAQLKIFSRNQLIAHVESMLLQLQTLAKPVETEDEKKARLKKDSVA